MMIQNTIDQIPNHQKVVELVDSFDSRKTLNISLQTNAENNIDEHREMDCEKNDPDIISNEHAMDVTTFYSKSPKISLVFAENETGKISIPGLKILIV